MKTPITYVPSANWKSHVRLWLFYFVLTYVFNVIGAPDVSLKAFSIMFALFIATFYFLVSVIGKWFASADHLRLAGAVLLAFFVLLGILYILVYEGLPRWGIHVVDKNRDFSAGKFIQEAYRNFQPALLGAIAYRLGTIGRKSSEERDNMEKQKLRVESENRTLQFTALSRQLESHWFHNVFNSMYARVAHNEVLANTIRSFTALMKYYFTHTSPQRRLVMLEREINHISNLFGLNQVADPEAVPAQWIVQRPLHARQIPPLILGTLVENACKYGDQSDPSQPIRAHLASTRTMLVFSCRNKTGSDREGRESHRLGLDNVRRQLDLVAPGRHELRVRNGSDFFDVTLTIYYPSSKL